MKTLNEFLDEGMVSTLKKGVKRHKDAVEKKKIKDRKAVPYTALAAQHEPEGELVDETYFDSNTRGVSTKGGLRKQYNKPGKLSQSSFSHERKSKDPELRMSKKELRKSMEDDANYEKKMGRSKPTPSNLKTSLKKMKKEEVANEDYYSGTGEKVQKRTKKWMEKKGQSGAPGLDAMKAREAEHKARRGVKKEEVVLEKDLSAAERRALPDSDFALPGKGKGPEGKQAGSYPIPDATHARAALAMVAKYGTPEEKEKVRAAVKRKFPDIQQEGVGAIAGGAAKVALAGAALTGKAAVKGAKFAGKTAAYLGKKAGNRIGKELVKATSDVDDNDDKEFDKVKVKRYKETPVKEDKAFDYVVAKLRKQHGKDAVLTKGQKPKPLSAAQKKKNAEIRAQRAKEDHRDETEKATSGRYTDRSRSD